MKKNQLMIFGLAGFLAVSLAFNVFFAVSSWNTPRVGKICGDADIEKINSIKYVTLIITSLNIYIHNYWFFLAFLKYLMLKGEGNFINHLGTGIKTLANQSTF